MYRLARRFPALTGILVIAGCNGIPPFLVASLGYASFLRYGGWIVLRLPFTLLFMKIQALRLDRLFPPAGQSDPWLAWLTRVPRGIRLTPHAVAALLTIAGFFIGEHLGIECRKAWRRGLFPQCRELITDMERYRTATGRYPASLRDLSRFLSPRDGYAAWEIPVDDAIGESSHPCNGDIYLDDLNGRRAALYLDSLGYCIIVKVEEPYFIGFTRFYYYIWSSRQPEWRYEYTIWSYAVLP